MNKTGGLFEFRILLGVSLLAWTGLAGCQSEKIEYTEVKRVHERLTVTEIKNYLRIIRSLPAKRVPKFPGIFAPPADWEPSRTLSVRDLVLEEEKQIENRWNEEVLVRQLAKSHLLLKKLKRARMTPQQFIGFTRTIGMALSRSTLHENQNLRKLLEQGNRVLAKLKEDHRSFLELSTDNEEEMHTVLQNAMWITRVDRINYLLKVPPENVKLIRHYQKQLKEIFPPDFTENPLDAVKDLLVEYGLPFEEDPLVGSDVDLAWDRSEAVIGKDAVTGTGGSQQLESERLMRIRELLNKE